LSWRDFIAIASGICYNFFGFSYLRVFGWKEGDFMKPKIHPRYEATAIACSCGNVIETRSTKKQIKVEVCSSCHPFYTGAKVRLVEIGGRIDRFKKKYGM
jgi:large subunit ribosomal protein L31